MDFELRRPLETDKEAVLEMIAAFKESDSAMDGFFATEDFVYEEWLETIGLQEVGLALPSGWVPSIQLVGFDLKSQQAVSFVNLRLRLNEFLLDEGGHIGYSVRPDRRQEGLAKASLAQALKIASAKNINEILVTCDQTNEGSRRVIVANGGILEDVRKGTERYWVKKTSE